MYPVPVTLQTNDEGNLSEFIYYRLVLIDLDILQILLNISGLTKKLCFHEGDYSSFVESLHTYATCSKVLKEALNDPIHKFECSEIEQALRGTMPANPFKESQSINTKNLKRDSFFNNLSSRIVELHAYYGKLSCKRWYGYPIGEAIDDLFYLSQQVSYLLPEDPDPKPYAAQQKGADKVKTQAQERHKKALELWHSGKKEGNGKWDSYAQFADQKYEELEYENPFYLTRLMPKLLKKQESL